MAYSTSAQIASEAKIGIADFTSSTNPTVTKVAEIIAEVDAKIDAKIGRVYTLPIPAGGASALILRSISIGLAVARVREIIQVQTGEAKEDQKPGGPSKSQAERDLQAIVDGEILLSDSTKISSTDGVRSYAVDNGLTPVMKKGIDQW